MKKLISYLLLAALIISIPVSLAACVKDEETKLDHIGAEVVKNTVFNVGDKFERSKITITAYLSDDTEKTITESNKGLIFDEKNLLLDQNNRFTKDGTFKLTIVYLNDYSAQVDIVVNKK